MEGVARQTPHLLVFSLAAHFRRRSSWPTACTPGAASWRPAPCWVITPSRMQICYYCPVTRQGQALCELHGQVQSTQAQPGSRADLNSVMPPL